MKKSQVQHQKKSSPPAQRVYPEESGSHYALWEDAPSPPIVGTSHLFCVFIGVQSARPIMTSLSDVAEWIHSAPLTTAFIPLKSGTPQ